MWQQGRFFPDIFCAFLLALKWRPSNHLSHIQNTLVSSAAITKYHEQRGLNNRKVLLQFWRPEVQNQGWFLLKSLRICSMPVSSTGESERFLMFLPCRRLHLCLHCLHVAFSLSSSEKNTARIGLRGYPTPGWPHLITSTTTLSPNKVTVWGPGG